MNIIEAILAVFSSMGEWFITFIPDFVGIFYNTTDGLTVIGAVSLAALAISVAFLIMNTIRSFLRFR